MTYRPLPQTFDVRALIPDGRLTLDEADTLATMRGRHIDDVWPNAPRTPHRTLGSQGHHAVVLLETGHTHEEVAAILSVAIHLVRRCDAERMQRIRRRAEIDARRATVRVAS